MLELKVIADAGLVGLPNAGKSTLLSRLSHAQPEIADYPFTTKRPNLGIVTIGGERAFVLADLPGLIEGAHHGVGLGHEFLRHVERTRVLVHLVEPLPPDGSDPLQNYRTIRRELELYRPALAVKPEVVAVSKAELTGSGAVRERMERELGREVLAISAVTGEGLARLVGAVVDALWRRRRRRSRRERGRRRRRGQQPHQVGRLRLAGGRPAVVRRASLADDPAAWEEQIKRWKEEFPLWKRAEALTWAVAGVHPERCGRLRELAACTRRPRPPTGSVRPPAAGCGRGRAGARGHGSPAERRGRRGRPTARPARRAGGRRLGRDGGLAGRAARLPRRRHLSRHPADGAGAARLHGPAAGNHGRPARAAAAGTVHGPGHASRRLLGGASAASR